MEEQQDYLSFSQRNGYEDVPLPLNPGELPYEVRNELEATLRMEYQKAYNPRCMDPTDDWDMVLKDLWVQIFKDRYVAYQAYPCMQRCAELINTSLFHCVVDFIEWLATRIGDKQPTLQNSINNIFLRYRVPYQLHKKISGGWIVIQTGTNQEKKAVLDTFSSLQDSRFKTTQQALENAGDYLCKNKNGDAVSQAAKAFEACLRTLAGKPDLTGGEALESFAKEHSMLTEMKDIMSSLWRYPNRKSGVGHAERDSPETPQPTNYEAQSYYVQCCRAIRYFLNLSRIREVAKPAIQKPELAVIHLNNS
jgi:hypothetical protein